MILTLGQTLLNQNAVASIPTAFNPNTIAGSIYWYDFTSRSFIVRSGSNITTAYNRGSRASDWLSTSGESSGNARYPSYGSVTLNGVDVGYAEFDPSNNEAFFVADKNDLSNEKEISLLPNTYTIWCVCDASDTTSSNKGMMAGRVPNRFTAFYLNDDVNVSQLVWDTSSFTSEGTAPSDLNDRAIFVSVCDKPNEALETWFNNSSNGGKDLTGKTLESSNFDMYVGKGNTSGAYMDGKIFACGIYDRALNTAERYLLQDGLARQFDITLS